MGLGCLYRVLAPTTTADCEHVRVLSTMRFSTFDLCILRLTSHGCEIIKAMQEQCVFEAPNNTADVAFSYGLAVGSCATIFSQAIEPRSLTRPP